MDQHVSHAFIELDKNLSAANMSDCMIVGISGNCGVDCPVLWRGDCTDESEMLEIVQMYEQKLRDIAVLVKCMCY